ncbi:MAG TPA: hypothetical protein VNO52_02275 [Methylomirabilota bacterium]|nr:hypothetical protein [Methylomirabilota bacterium]
MSLINDALKRAQETQAQAARRESSAPFQPVEYTRHSQTGAVYVSVGLMSLMLGAVFLFRGWEASQNASGRAGAVPVSARERFAPAAVAEWPAENPAQPEVQVDTVIPPDAEAPESFNVTRDFALDPPGAGATEIAAAPAPAPPPQVEMNADGARPNAAIAPVVTAPPALRLQAIFYRPSGASAVINGRTLFQGDRIEGARVIAISRDSVTLQGADGPRVLTLP